MAAKEPAGNVAPQMNWGDLLERLQSNASTHFIFPKAGRTRVRLLTKPGEPFYVEVQAEYQGRSKTKYMLLAIDMGAEEEDKRPKGLIVSKTVFKSFVSLLTEGHELFDPEKGYGVTIIRSGAGLDTSYSVVPSPKPIHVSQDVIEDCPTFASLQEEYKKLRDRPAAGGNANGNATPGEGDWE
jgi:hypothetical protein